MPERSAMQTLNKVCYTLCVVSICGSAAAGLGMVWFTDADQTLWRFLMSFMILFLASAAMLAVNNTLIRRP